MTLALRSHAGRRLPLDPGRWHRPPTGDEQRLLAGLPSPVLDVGCGPGRIVTGLARLGKVALGVDPAHAAVRLARQRGADVLQRSVFDPLPGHGRWMAVLLLDGNLGIGGDPVRLLRRCGELTAPTGVVVVEVHGPGVGHERHCARLEDGPVHGAWFPWSVVGIDALGDVAAAAGLSVLGVHHWVREERWFAWLRSSGNTHGAG